MSICRRVEVPAGQTVQVVPPDATYRVGAYVWTIDNPESESATVDLVDDPSKAAGEGFAFGPGDPAVRLMERSDAVWAAAGGQDAVLQVIGVSWS